jgi:hypothetical protein
MSQTSSRISVVKSTGLLSDDRNASPIARQSRSKVDLRLFKGKISLKHRFLLISIKRQIDLISQSTKRHFSLVIGN